MQKPVSPQQVLLERKRLLKELRTVVYIATGKARIVEISHRAMEYLNETLREAFRASEIVSLNIYEEAIDLAVGTKVPDDLMNAILSKFEKTGWVIVESGLGISRPYYHFSLPDK